MSGIENKNQWTYILEGVWQTPWGQNLRGFEDWTTLKGQRRCKTMNSVLGLN